MCLIICIYNDYYVKPLSGDHFPHESQCSRDTHTTRPFQYAIHPQSVPNPSPMCQAPSFSNCHLSPIHPPLYQIPTCFYPCLRDDWSTMAPNSTHPLHPRPGPQHPNPTKLATPFRPSPLKSTGYCLMKEKLNKTKWKWRRGCENSWEGWRRGRVWEGMVNKGRGKRRCVCVCSRLTQYYSLNVALTRAGRVGHSGGSECGLWQVTVRVVHSSGSECGLWQVTVRVGHNSRSECGLSRSQWELGTVVGLSVGCDRSHWEWCTVVDLSVGCDRSQWEGGGQQ